jgi:uncharacterized protein YebE (UPF0316 family)
LETFIVNALGISPQLFNYLILPLLIFMARVTDVSLATMRVMYIMNGAKRWAPILGFFESMIWLLAIGQIIQNISNAWSYLAYASGYATGNFVGMLIEEKIAMGRMVVRIIGKSNVSDLIGWLIDKGYRYNSVEAMDHEGNANILFTVVPRSKLDEFLKVVRYYQPDAYYTVEGVKRVSDDDVVIERPKTSISRYLPLVRK